VWVTDEGKDAGQNCSLSRNVGGVTSKARGGINSRHRIVNPRGNAGRKKLQRKPKVRKGDGEDQGGMPKKGGFLKSSAATSAKGGDKKKTDQEGEGKSSQQKKKRSPTPMKKTGRTGGEPFVRVPREGRPDRKRQRIRRKS